MTNKTIIFASAIAVALVAGVVSSGMLVEAAPIPKDVFVTNDVTNAIPVTGIASSPVCPQENVQHWMKVRYVTQNSALEHDTLPLLTGYVEVTLLTDPDVPTSLAEKVADKLTSLGYTRVDSGGVPTTSIIGIPLEVSYSTICAGP